MKSKILTTIAKSAALCVMLLAFIGLSNTTYDDYIYKYKGSSVVKLTKSYQERSGGTGFIVKAPSGRKYLLTNAHICRIGNTLVAKDYKGRKTKVSVVEVYKKHDLCLMTAIQDLPALSVAASLQVKDKVHLLGHPALRALTKETGHFVGPTVIRLLTKCSPKHQAFLKQIWINYPNLTGIIAMQYYRRKYCTKHMTSNHINNIAYGGNSGSPVINIWGNVVGVLYAGRNDQPTASHTVPLKEIKNFLKNK